MYIRNMKQLAAAGRRGSRRASARRSGGTGPIVAAIIIAAGIIAAALVGIQMHRDSQAREAQRQVDKAIKALDQYTERILSGSDSRDGEY